MLIQNQPDENNVASAAAERVTTEELTKALAAIEARRQADSRFTAGTLPIGQAIAELSLDVSSEELLAEVKALRAARSVRSSPTKPTAFFNLSLFIRRHPKIVGGLVAAVLFGSLVLSIVYTMTPDPSESGTAPPPAVDLSKNSHYSVAPDAEFYRKLALCSGASPSYEIVGTPLTYNASEQNGAEAVAQNECIYPERAVPDGYSIFKRASLPTGLDANENETGGVVLRPIGDHHLAVDPEFFISTRYNGRRYRRCWIARSNISKMRRGRQVTVWPSSMQALVAHEHRVPVTIPEACFVAPTGTGPQKVRGVPETQHTWENFTRLTVPRYLIPAWAYQPMVFLAPDGIMSDQDASRYPIPGRALFDANSMIRQFRMIREGQVIHCSSYTLAQFMKLIDLPVSTNDVYVDARPSLLATFTLIKHDGQPYLRGWIAVKPRRQRLLTGSLMLHSRPDAPDFTAPPVPVTICLDRFELLQGLTSLGATSFPPMNSTDDPFMRLEITHVRIDQYAWEHHRTDGTMMCPVSRSPRMRTRSVPQRA